MAELRQLTGQFPHAGKVDAIYLRPARGAPATNVSSALAIAHRGLEGDRSAQARAGHRRQVTLMQTEHGDAIAGWLRRDGIDPAVFRRNLQISGLNLLSARALFADQPTRILIGALVVLEVTGPCEPCSKMEVALGAGAYNAMRGHGGVTAAVVRGGMIAVGDAVRIECATTQA